MALDPRLAASLDHLAHTAAAIGLDDDWIAFGGAAMALSGHEGEVPDIDVLAGPDTAARLIEALNARRLTPPADGPFRSSLLARSDDAETPIEIMVGLEVNTPEGWAPVVWSSRVLRRAGQADLPVPSIAEQIVMARRFGRPKDLIRAEALERLAG